MAAIPPIEVPNRATRRIPRSPSQAGCRRRPPLRAARRSTVRRRSRRGRADRGPARSPSAAGTGHRRGQARPIPSSRAAAGSPRMDRRSSRRWSGQPAGSQRPARRNPSRERSRTTHHRAHRARAKRRLGRADAGRVEQSVRHPSPTARSPTTDTAAATAAATDRRIIVRARGGRDLERLEDDPAPALQVDPGGDLGGRVAKAPDSLVVSRTLTGRPSASASTTTPRWTAPTSVVSSFSRAYGVKVASKRATSLVPLAAQAAGQPVIDRFDVTADADRPAGRAAGHHRPPASGASGSTAHGRAARGTG